MKRCYQQTETSSRKTRPTMPWWSAAIVLLAFGCAKNLGVPDSQLLVDPLPQQQVLQARADDVWRAMLTEANASAERRLLVQQRASGLISWCENINEPWTDLGKDELGLKEKDVRKLEESPPSGVAITSVWVEPMGSSSCVHVRRVYYGSGTFAGMAHSRGDYEQELMKRVARRLGLSEYQVSSRR